MPIKEPQKTHKQHAVPQNIMDVEFRLIGDLTMRQFTYLFVFGALAYLGYITLSGIFKYPIPIVFVLLGLALAFVPIQERGMDEWLVNFFRSVYSPNQRVWKKEAVLPSVFTYQNIAMVRQEMITLAPTSSRRKLEEYLELQQKTQIEDKLDIPEKEYVLKVRQAFAPVAVEVEAEETQYTEEVYEYEEVQPETPEIPAQEFAPEEEAVEIQKPREEPAKEGELKPQKPEKEKKVEKKPKAVKKHKIPRPKPKPKTKTPSFPDTFTVTPITPDRHIGRKFTSMLPSEGELILPVRGEKILQTSEQIDIEEDIDEKTAQLKKLLKQIKADKDLQGVEIPPETVAVGGDQKQEISEAKGVVRKFKEENERLTNEIEKLKKDVEVSDQPEEEKQKKMEMIQKLKEEQQKANTDYTALQRQIHELQKRLAEKEKPEPSADTQPKKATYAKMQPITNEPNIISGIVKNQDGDAIPGVVLLIKNNKGEAVRALKTNAIGQFSISTPLAKSMYTLEVGSSVEGLTFDIITVEINGEVLPPIEIIGRPI